MYTMRVYGTPHTAVVPYWRLRSTFIYSTFQFGVHMQLIDGSINLTPLKSDLKSRHQFTEKQSTTEGHLTQHQLPQLPTTSISITIPLCVCGTIFACTTDRSGPTNICVCVCTVPSSIAPHFPFSFPQPLSNYHH